MLEKLCERIMRRSIVWLIVAALIAVLFPIVFNSRYVLRIGIVCLMYVMLALSLNFMTGMLGQMSFGHAAFWGIGAYTAAILSTRFGLTSEITFLAAAAMAGLFGLLLGLPVLRLKGYYFTIVTMVFCQIIRVIEINWMDLTRGPLGIMAIPKPRFFGLVIQSQTAFFYLMLTLVVITTVVIRNIMNSRAGYAILAVRDDDLAASAMGVNVYRCKVSVIVISAMLAGVAGAFYAQYTSYIDPSNFTNAQSNAMLVMVIFGGLGNIVGSFIGAITLSVLPELLRDFSQYRQLVYGILLVALMLLRPDGILGSINFRYIAQRVRQKTSAGGGKHG